MTDKDELDSILHEISSCRLDIQPSSKRNEIIQEAERLLLLDDNDVGDRDYDLVLNALLSVGECFELIDSLIH